jgi:hypothetical protein
MNKPPDVGAPPPCITGASRRRNQRLRQAQTSTRPAALRRLVERNPEPPTPTRVGSERRLLNEQDDRAEPPSNQRDVRVELVARSGLFGCDATRSCNSCRCGRAVDSAQRFRSSSIARTPWARPLVPARRGEAGAARPVCAQTREGLAGSAPVRLRRGACGGTRRLGSGRPSA